MNKHNADIALSDIADTRVNLALLERWIQEGRDDEAAQTAYVIANVIADIGRLIRFPDVEIVPRDRPDARPWRPQDIKAPPGFNTSPPNV